MARILITSALPYINGVKHLGNLVGSMLPADVHARFHRQLGNEVVFICGTDEHGTPAELAAVVAGQHVRTYCDEQHDIQKELCAGFNLSFDWFGRSSSAHNRVLTQQFAIWLEANGFIEERETRQIYSVADARFLPDRYVEGICPSCGHDRARGDQCDKCGRLIEPTELIDPRSKISGSRDLEIRTTRHLFLLQSKLQGRIRSWVDGATGWPRLATSIAYKWLDEGLDDRPITRDLEWGIPVVLPDGSPRPGFENKVFYVWFDAPIEYIAATQEWSDATGQDWRRWWRTDEGASDVTYLQFMGKDNVAFHTVSFPATIIGSGEPWKLVDRLKAFNWLDWYGGKFSTSEGRGIFMDAALELLPADYWRWYLIANAPENSDTSFRLDLFQSCVNADLVKTLGNLVNRLTSFAYANFEGVIPAGVPRPEDAPYWQEARERIAEITAAHGAMEFRRAATATRALWALGNRYLAETAPWTLIRSDRTGAASVVASAAWLLEQIACVSAPIIPDTAKLILEAIGVAQMSDEVGWVAYAEPPTSGFMREIPSPIPLFTTVKDEHVRNWSARFSC